MLEYAPRTKECTDYDRAWLYCVTCTHDNKYDWRLPTTGDVTEYPSIIKNNFIPPYDWFYVTPVRDTDA